MKRKNSATTNLRAFLARATAKKRQAEPKSVPQSCNESQMQVVVFQGQSGSGQTFDSGTSTVPPEPVRAMQRQLAVPQTESCPVACKLKALLPFCYFILYFICCHFDMLIISSWIISSCDQFY